MTDHNFTTLDWAIVGAYLLFVLVLGAAFARRQRTSDQYFLAGRSVPLLVASVSILATSLSAVTFIGAPEDAFRGDLTYLSLNIGAILGAIVVALLFIPAFYKRRVTTVYELLGNEYGPAARKCASAMYMVGRLLASGARLFIAAIPVSLIVFGDLDPRNLQLAIVIVALVAAVYTVAGGMRAVVWTDLAQVIILVGAALLACALLFDRIPLGVGDIVSTLRAADTPAGTDKLTLINLSADPTLPYTLWVAIFGFTLFNMAAYGADQDLVQRMLACKSAAKASWSVVLSNLVGVGVVFIFMTLGLLLYIYYARPDVMGAAAPDAAIDDTRQVFLSFILHEMPPGLRGLMIAGLFAAAMSSLDSALNAMSTTAVCDFYKPLRPGRSDRHYLRAARIGVALWGVALAAVACVLADLQSRGDAGLLQFALAVMVYAYAGMLGVFLTALCTNRGNSATVAAALAAGFLTVLILHHAPALIADDTTLAHKLWPLPDPPPTLSMGWRMLIGTLIATITCCAGKRPKKPTPTTPPSPSSSSSPYKT
ncbi:MAG: sodium:solute symporter [Phycisphaerales bacterium]|nr:MAG: sodium:solute symporter [Phycisphaerales bacterium]